MMIPTQPHPIDENLYRWNINLSELVAYKAARDSDGYIDYMGAIPEGEKMVICAVECNDGLYILVWEKKWSKNDDSY